MKSCNIIYNGDKAYQIIDEIAIHHFLNKNGDVNRQVLGMYVNEKRGNHVLQRNDKFLICNEIEDAVVIK